MDIKTRFLFGPELSDLEALPIEQGGTGSVSAKGARAKLRLLGSEDLNKPNGAVARDAQGFLPRDIFPPEISDPSIPSLFGPDQVITTKTVQYTITNYDTSAIYTAIGLGGVLSREVDVITFTANSTPGPGAIIINGRTYPIQIILPEIETPVIESPLNGDTISFSKVLIVASTFNLDQTNAVHSGSDWQLSLNTEFNQLLESVYNSNDLTQWAPTYIKELTQHFVRCRYRSQSGLVSAWSTPVAFTTGNDGLINTEIQRLVAQNYYPDSRFGNSFAVSDDKDYILIGAYNDDNTALDSGAVYFYKRVNGVYTNKQYIKAPVPLTSEMFGLWVAMNPEGTLAVICAPAWTGTAINKGSAYIYSRTGDVWLFVQKLTPSDLLPDAHYGSTAVISRDSTTIAIGAAYADAGKGAVYIYALVSNTWTLQSKVSPSQTDQWQDMAWQLLSLSSDGNTLAAGAHGADISGFIDAGCIYIYTRTGSTWSEQAKLVASDSETSKMLSARSGGLSSDGNIVVTGCYPTANTPNGAIYVFKRSGTTWTQVQKIVPNDLASNDKFGGRVEFKGNKMLVANLKQTPYVNSGEVYVYTFDGTAFNFSNKFTPPATYPNSYFGYRLYLSYDGTMGFIAYLTQNGGDEAGSLVIHI